MNCNNHRPVPPNQNLPIGNEDLVTIKSEEETDTLNMMFESPNQVCLNLLFLIFDRTVNNCTGLRIIQFLQNVPPSLPLGNIHVNLMRGLFELHSYLPPTFFFELNALFVFHTNILFFLFFFSFLTIFIFYFSSFFSFYNH